MNGPSAPLTPTERRAALRRWTRKRRPDYRPVSFGKRGIKIMRDHAHVAMVLRIKQELQP